VQTAHNIVALCRLLGAIRYEVGLSVCDSDLVLHCPVGCRTIINTVLNIVLGVLEFGMNGRAAVDSPRLHHQWLPDETTFEAGAIPEEVQGKLKEMGHILKMDKREGGRGDGNSILIDPASGVACGVNDKRSPDGKASKF
jgi:gamma-glutamyltranspeptidase / glutathione hydrolase